MAVVKNARGDNGSREWQRYENLSDKVDVGRIPDHFLCLWFFPLNIDQYYFYHHFRLFAVTIESTGSMPAGEIMLSAVKVLKQKCRTLLDELDKSSEWLKK